MPEASTAKDLSEMSASATTPELPPVIDTTGKQKQSTRLATRTRKKQEAAAAAVEAADDNPALGALNRHLNMMMQQLATAHRVIGRVAAERDALRQQLADLQGIPVEEIVVTTIGASTEQPTRSSTPIEPEPKSRWEKLNYFGGDDVAVMRRRRQTFVLVLVLVIAMLGVTARQLGWSPPENVSRDGLAALPVIGNVMFVFLAAWMMFRVVRVSSKGVRWMFPTEDRRRRRR